VFAAKVIISLVEAKIDCAVAILVKVVFTLIDVKRLTATGPRLDAAVFVVNETAVPSYSIAPATGMVRLLPEVNLIGAEADVPAERVNADAVASVNVPPDIVAVFVIVPLNDPALMEAVEYEPPLITAPFVIVPPNDPLPIDAVENDPPFINAEFVIVPLNDPAFIDAEERLLFVKISVVVRATKVSVTVGNVNDPVLTIVLITGFVKVLLVNVCVIEAPTKVSVPTGRIKLPEPATAVAIIVEDPEVEPRKINPVPDTEPLVIVTIDAVPESVLLVNVCVAVVVTIGIELTLAPDVNCALGAYKKPAEVIDAEVTLEAELICNPPVRNGSYVALEIATVVVGSVCTLENSFQIPSRWSRIKPVCWYVPLLNAPTIPTSAVFAGLPLAI